MAKAEHPTDESKTGDKVKMVDFDFISPGHSLVITPPHDDRPVANTRAFTNFEITLKIVLKMGKNGFILIEAQESSNLGSYKFAYPRKCIKVF